MRTRLILVSLLSLCSLCISEECSHELLENVDFPGTDITSLYSPDVNHCQQLCTQHPSCLFFTFIRPDWTRDNRHFYCYLKSTPSGQPNVQTPLLGVTSGFSLKPCYPETKPCLSQVYQNVDFLGADYRFLFTSDYEECQRACTQDPGCQFFTFVNGVFTLEKIRYKCHLKFSWTIPRIPTIERKAGVVSGFSHKAEKTQSFDTVCQGKLFPRTEIKGNSIETLPAASPEHCQTLCSAHPLCTYFSYTSNDFNCYLKNNPNEMVTISKEGATSGLPARFCQLDNSWVLDAHEGIDFRGSDISYELMDDPDMCQWKCTEDPNCQFYTYVNESFFDRNYWRRCYLKRVITIPAPPKVTQLSNVVSGFSLKNCVERV
ncbi:coagulation factor XI-like [Thunnus albacares]|uniref:coagulation factor XI-like n=1 Tax=Thunnus albacares TaxID=8236 RepID=UPI001CF65F2C|nr:coagulation factor XI-like [Thunnus albacares]